ncbi:GGDEF domain-containing protein [Endozoicomonadaceae bacterium StTr2]
MSHRDETELLQPVIESSDTVLASAMLRLAACREKSALDNLLVELVREKVNGAPVALVSRDSSGKGKPSILAVSGVSSRQQKQFLGKKNLTLPMPSSVKDEESPCVLLIGVKDEEPSKELILLIQMYHSVHELLARSTHDRLTRLFNRHSLQETLEHIYGHAPERRKGARSQTGRERWVMALLDLDHFKQVNDQYGHLMGDEVLLAFSDLMLHSFRQHDRLFRYGGEEFVILMGDISLDDASRVLNRFREQVARFDFPHSQKLTVSIGFASMDLNCPPECVLEKADRALYEAKNSGRNRVEWAKEEPPA